MFLYSESGSKYGTECCAVYVLICFSPVWLFATLWTVAHQAPLFMASSGKNTGMGCHTLLQGIFWSRDRTQVLYIAGGFFTTNVTWEAYICRVLGPYQISRINRDSWASFVAQLVKNPSAMWETWVWSLGWEDPLENGMATHSSILSWRIPWTV